MKIIDARGLSCPEPVVLLRSAMSTGEDSYQIIVDNHASRENTTRYAQHMGYKVTERDIEIGELVKAYDEGKFDEAFGSGTAAVISPIGELKYGDKHMTINGGKIGPISQKLYDTLTGIQWGKLPDEFGWTVKID